MLETLCSLRKCTESVCRQSRFLVPMVIAIQKSASGQLVCFASPHSVDARPLLSRFRCPGKVCPPKMTSDFGSLQ